MPDKFPQVVKPYNDDPFVGHLATPISASDFTKTFIGNLPAYRRGLSPLVRGLEVGLAHGYWLVGPWTVFGPLRDTDVGYLGGLISALALILIATACLSIYGIAKFQAKLTNPDDTLQSAEGWSQFAGGFFIGGMGGAFVAYFLLSNFDVVDQIFRGTVNF
ncbi:photosystem I reaction center protein subunit XI [Pleurocapsales cyanobacterium LEGE 06147]|nr:photosystem I reaction center protein subunit XI [Pleurocapsales cyanobacterium LEGE 06147]